jgi:predicted lactoylglutathione lyase
MPTQIFVNIPVKNLDRSVKFYTALGFTFNPTFTDANATCMIVGENIFVMLLVEPYFKSFIKKDVADARRVAEAIICISADGRGAIDEMVKKAIAAGGSVTTEAKDLGFMYQHGFEDPDGHLWELVHMTGEPPKA